MPATKLPTRFAMLLCGVAMAGIASAQPAQNPMAANASAQQHYETGNKLRQRHHWHDARLECGEALSLQPQYPDAHVCLGRTLGQQGNWGGATLEFQAALRLQPE